MPIQLAQLSMDWSNLSAGAAVTAVAAGASTVAGIGESLNGAISSIKEFFGGRDADEPGGSTLHTSSSGREHGGLSGNFGGNDDLMSRADYRALKAKWAGKPTVASTPSKSVTVENTLAAIGNALNSVMADVSISGNMGGSAVYTRNVIVNAHFCQLPEEDNAHLGKPLCKMYTMKNLDNGFYKVLSGDIPISGTSDEQQLLKAHLEGGFYIERGGG